MLRKVHAVHIVGGTLHPSPLWWLPVLEQEIAVKCAWMTDYLSVRILCLIYLQDDQSAYRAIAGQYESYLDTMLVGNMNMQML